MRGRKIDTVKLVLANGATASYPEGGGHFSVHLQYMLGLEALGIDWYLLQFMSSKKSTARDEFLVDTFLQRLASYGLKDRAAVLVFGDEFPDVVDLDRASIYGSTREKVNALVREADMVWDYCFVLAEPLLSKFRRRVLIDLDPGEVHVPAMTGDFELGNHDVFLTVGSKIRDADTKIPTMGIEWHPFFPPVFMPMWETVESPPPGAPFTSVTQWTWSGGVEFEERLISVSKREAYLRYLDLPLLVDQPFELAANIRSDDETGDRETLEGHNWRLVDPHVVAATPELYRNYIRSSKAELSCPKEVYRALRTGWFSDRSAVYLASGRPVLAEDTGFSDHLPTGEGLLTFTNIDEAVAGVQGINRDFERHARVAREIASEHFDATKVLRRMITAG